jgi:hypothetical protein
VRLTFVQLRMYLDDARRLRLTDDDQRSLEDLLLANPAAGAVMQGTGGLRKLRHAPQSRSGGKSGGVRICYAYFPRFAHVYFVVAFAKNEQSNLTPRQRRTMYELIREIEGYLDRSRQ